MLYLLMFNKYQKYSKISDAKFREILHYFSYNLVITKVSEFTSKDTFYLHLKECEFRYNNRDKNIYKLLLKKIRKKPLKLS